MNGAALKVELERHHPASYGWARSCCIRNPADAEDVLQIVYLKILEGKAHFRGESSFKTWLFAVIRNTALTERRRQLLRLRFSEVAPPSFRPGPELALETSERQARFQAALRQLPRRQREVLHLVFYEDFSLQEASAVMGISLGSARTHYERGKKRLRALLSAPERKHGIEWRRQSNPDAVS